MQGAGFWGKTHATRVTNNKAQNKQEGTWEGQGAILVRLSNLAKRKKSEGIKRYLVQAMAFGRTSSVSFTKTQPQQGKKNQTHATKWGGFPGKRLG